MDLSQSAELFLAESRENLSACTRLLLVWDPTPANPAPVAGLFRAVHTVKGMAATMGYGRVTDIAHRTENLLDLLRRGSRPPADEPLQLLFRARDALARRHRRAAAALVPGARRARARRRAVGGGTGGRARCGGGRGRSGERGRAGRASPPGRRSTGWRGGTRGGGPAGRGPAARATPPAPRPPGWREGRGG